MNKPNQKERPAPEESKDLLSKRFLTIAHRGASAYAPENTMAAFDLAYKMGADMIELDVQFSKDGVPVVMHDFFLDVHTNGKGLVKDYSASEILKLDAGKWFSLKFEGEKVPLLSDVLKWSADKLFVNIEVKSDSLLEPADPGQVKVVAELIAELEIEERVLLSSFSYDWIDAFKNTLPDVMTGLLYNKHHPEKGDPGHLMRRFGADFFHCSSHEMKSSWAKQLNEEGKNFMIYTVNRRKGMLKWMKKGAFGIFSDKPDLLKRSAELFFEDI